MKMDKILKLKLIPIYLISRILGKNLYLYTLIYFQGLYYYFKRPKISKVMLPFFILFICSALFSLINKDFLGFRRSIQVILMLGFSHFLVFNFNSNEREQLLKNCIIIFSLFFVVEFIIGYRPLTRSLSLFGFELKQFQGAMGNPNHTGIAIASLANLFLINKNYKFWAWSSVLILMTLSRSAAITFFLGFLIPFIDRIPKKLFVIFSKSFVIGLISIPLLLFFLEHSLSNSAKLIIDNLSSYRYTLQLSFLEMFKDNIWGVGHDYSHNLFNAYKMKGSTLLTEGIVTLPWSDNGSHSTWVKILVELGVWGYLIFSYFIWKLTNLGLKNDFKITYAFLVLMIGFSSLNGLNEFSFYLYLSFFIAMGLNPQKRDDLF